MQHLGHALETGPVDARRTAARRWSLTALAAFLTVGVLLGGRWLYGGSSATHEPDREQPAAGMACGSLDDGRSDAQRREDCLRRASDRSRRAAADPSMGPQDDAMKEIRSIVSAALRCPAGDPASCVMPPAQHEPNKTDADTARVALHRHGFTDAIVRIASGDDPAPAGALIYAVRIERTCVIGYLQQAPSGPGSDGAVGLLPGQTCLASG
jgi:hypothetical protein